jgi:VanZ family protein
MLLITYWSDQSTLPIDTPQIRSLLFDLQHRLAHLVAYGLLGLLAAWAFEGWSKATLLAIALTAVFAATDEYHQSLVPGRRARVDDWLFDIFSAALAIYIWPRISSKRPALTTLAPLVVGAIFAVGIFFLALPHLSRPSEVSRASIRNIGTQLITNARDVARQIRSAASG